MNPRFRTVAAATSLFLALVGTSGCRSREPGAARGGDDPIEALSAGTVSADYDAAYWGEQRRNHSELWQRASAYCDGKDGSRYPNCRPVLSLLLLDRTLDRPATSAPGFDGSMDMTGRADSVRSRLDSLRSTQ